MVNNFFDLSQVKKLLGESGGSLDERIREAGELADSDIFSALTNIETLPMVTVPPQLTRVGNFLTIGYFYFLENGDDKGVDKGIEKLDRYIKTKYGQPKAKTRGAF